LVCEAIGTAATPGLLCQPRVIVKMIVEKQMECRLAEEPKFSEKTCPIAIFVHHKIPHNQTPVWTRAAAVGHKVISNFPEFSDFLNYRFRFVCCEDKEKLNKPLYIQYIVTKIGPRRNYTASNGLSKHTTLKWSAHYDKFWEELIAYFPLIQHGQHTMRKRGGRHKDTQGARSLATIGHTQRQQGVIISLICLKNWGGGGGQTDSRLSRKPRFIFFEIRMWYTHALLFVTLGQLGLSHLH
jgi:hypothetical protein